MFSQPVEVTAEVVEVTANSTPGYNMCAEQPVPQAEHGSGCPPSCLRHGHGPARACGWGPNSAYSHELA